ncbi:hypothetical protein K488DRAFT_90874 [Vararia minispora EC-137]|uniref:Uncharacterized protein n=1 Tax=Vararia minispora EC-137 TaxID=1314806 RepID=A0ACB8Q6W5_9AGAM|nr:hypothetical protein K488DRAFT_90874 [Vararia minispora EC-137]
MSREATIFRAVVILGWIGSVTGQVAVTAPNCTLSTYSWTTNSFGQDVCHISGISLSPCAPSGSDGITRVTVDTLNASDPHDLYIGPSKDYGDTDNLFMSSNTRLAVNRALSACGGCQGASWLPYSGWKAACAKVADDGVWPSEQVGFPAHAAFPAWAFLPINNSFLTWDNLTAFSYFLTSSPQPILLSKIDTLIYTFTDSTEVTSSSGPTNPAPSSGTTPSQTSGTPSSGALNVGTIAGCVVGGVVGAALLIALGWYLYSRRNRRGVAASAAFLGYEPGSAGSDAPAFIGQGSVVSTAPFKRYDPADPSTYPNAMIGGGQAGQSTTGFASSSLPGKTTNTAHQPGRKVISSRGGQDIGSDYRGLPEF